MNLYVASALDSEQVMQQGRRCEQNGSHNGEIFPVPSLRRKMSANLPRIHFHQKKLQYESRLDYSCKSSLPLHDIGILQSTLIKGKERC